MFVFSKIQNVLSTLLFLAFSLFAISCEEETDASYSDLFPDNKNVIVDNNNVYKSEQEPEPIAYVKNKSLIFFRLSHQEYQSLLNQSGEVASYEFSLLFQRFDRVAQEFGRRLLPFGIESDLLIEHKIIFMGDSSEVLFDRVERDFILGQIFFDGRDSIIIEDGYIEPSELQNMVRLFFQTDTIVVDMAKFILAADTLGYADSSSVYLHASDTISVRDTTTFIAD